MPPAKAPGSLPPPAELPVADEAPAAGRTLVYVGAGLAVAFMLLLGLTGVLDVSAGRSNRRPRLASRPGPPPTP